MNDVPPAAWAKLLLLVVLAIGSWLGIGLIALGVFRAFTS